MNTWTTASEHEPLNSLGACPHNQNKNVLEQFGSYAHSMHEITNKLGCGLTLPELRNYIQLQNYNNNSSVFTHIHIVFQIGFWQTLDCMLGAPLIDDF